MTISAISNMVPQMKTRFAQHRGEKGREREDTHSSHQVTEIWMTQECGSFSGTLFPKIKGEK